MINLIKTGLLCGYSLYMVLRYQKDYLNKIFKNEKKEKIKRRRSGLFKSA